MGVAPLRTGPRPPGRGSQRSAWGPVGGRCSSPQRAPAVQRVEGESEGSGGGAWPLRMDSPLSSIR